MLASPQPAVRRQLGAGAVAALIAFGYTLLIGGTAVGEWLPGLLIVNALMAGGLVLYYVLQAPTHADRTDKFLLLGIVLFAAAGAASHFPRQSFDAVLGALVWGAALFAARRLLAREPIRTTFVRVVVVLSATLTIVTAARWLPLLQDWWSIGNSPVPPLDFEYAGWPWGHRHDLALLLALLYPAWWIGRMSSARRASAVIFGLLMLLIVVVDGSRNNWLALAAATVSLVAARAIRGASDRRRLGYLVAAAATIVIVALIVSGIGAALLGRVLDLTNLQYRLAMWGPLTWAWLSHPVTGYGPGSFPWVLQTTDYFKTNSLAPHHPDSVLFQVLPEAGLLGAVALLIVVGVLLPPILRGRSTGAKWAVIAFAVAGLGANPTDFGFLLAVAVGWAAYATPSATHGPQPQAARFSWSPPLLASLACLGIVGVAYAATLAAAVAYGRAGDSVGRGDLAPALADLSTAASLDPGMALYARQRGALHYLLGDSAAAITDLTRATRLNPSDDLAWRTLAMAYRAAKEERAAEGALAQAVATQRSNPTNLLLTARWQEDTGHPAEALLTLGEVVYAWPAITGAPGWSDLVPSSSSTEGVIEQAVARWERGDPSPEPFSGQGLWLAILGGRPDLLERAIEVSGTDRFLADAAVGIFRCDPRGQGQLESAPGNDRHTYFYWLLRLRASAMSGTPDENARRLVVNWSGGTMLPADARESLNPLNRNDPSGFDTDVWGYRRPQIDWPLVGAPLPSPHAGTVRWLLDPLGATRAAGLEDRLPGCH